MTNNDIRIEAQKAQVAAYKQAIQEGTAAMPGDPEMFKLFVLALEEINDDAKLGALR